MTEPITSKPSLELVLRETTLERLRASNGHDAIVVGAGAAGALAAMLLSEGGLRVLVLDAGLPLNSLRGPLGRFGKRVIRRMSGDAALKYLPPVLIPKARKAIKVLGRRRQPIQSRCYAWEGDPDSFVDDRDCPYLTPPDRPFVWIRSRKLGGRLFVPLHGRQYYRLGPDDFTPPDGLSPSWPLRPSELDQWYTYVELRLGISGMKDGVASLPDSDLVHVLEFTGSERALKNKILERWPGARPILSRYAPPLHALEAAAATGRMQCRQGAIVREVRVDDSGNVCGVSWIDHQTRTEQQSSAPLVFLCASALESTRLLMLSRSRTRPEGLGSSSGSLGRYLMDHLLVHAQGFGTRDSVDPISEQGRCIYLPRFDARENGSIGAGRGFGVQVYRLPAAKSQFYFVASSFAEMLPRWENHVSLDFNRRDAWGIPILRIECGYSEMELERAKDQTEALRELAQIAGAQLTEIDEMPHPPGSSFHECGTARMGSDPSNSVLDMSNQCWDARGLYVTDAACFPSQGYQNPTLTILALTARACHHALVRSERGLPLETQ